LVQPPQNDASAAYTTARILCFTAELPRNATADDDDDDDDEEDEDDDDDADDEDDIA
jgi:hypothetical protein